MMLFLPFKLLKTAPVIKRQIKPIRIIKITGKAVFPRDAFHVACDAHKTRIKNTLRFSGIDPIEKTLLIQRLDNLSTAQSGYIAKQKKALAD